MGIFHKKEEPIKYITYDEDTPDNIRVKREIAEEEEEWERLHGEDSRRAFDEEWEKEQEAINKNTWNSARCYNCNKKLYDDSLCFKGYSTSIDEIRSHPKVATMHTMDMICDACKQLFEYEVKTRVNVTRGTLPKGINSKTPEEIAKYKEVTEKREVEVRYYAQNGETEADKLHRIGISEEDKNTTLMEQVYKIRLKTINENLDQLTRIENKLDLILKKLGI